MKTQIVEVTNGPMNWGKFLVGTFDEEWQRTTALPGFEGHATPLLRSIGWGPLNVLVFDLQTREGAIFYPHPSRNAKDDLNMHPLWVCPMFEPFLEWLYRQPDVSRFPLPPHVDLPDAPFAMHGYRRDGPKR